MSPITIDPLALAAIVTASGVAGGALLWMARRYDDILKIPSHEKALKGDDASRDPKERDGALRRLDDTEVTVGALVKFNRALCVALRIPPTSDEHVIAAAVERAIANGSIVVRGSGVQTVEGDPIEDTGRHRAILVEALPAPAPTRRPTPYRGPAIPREEPDGTGRKR